MSGTGTEPLIDICRAEKRERRDIKGGGEVRCGSIDRQHQAGIGAHPQKFAKGRRPHRRTAVGEFDDLLAVGDLPVLPGVGQDDRQREIEAVEDFRPTGGRPHFFPPTGGRIEKDEFPRGQTRRSPGFFGLGEPRPPERRAGRSGCVFPKKFRDVGITEFRIRRARKEKPVIPGELATLGDDEVTVFRR